MTFGTAGSRIRLACLLVAAALGTAAHGQSTSRAIQGVDVQKLANGILGVMSYTVAPDVTTSTLTITNGATSNPGLSMTQLGGGFTWSKSTPLYLEGNAAWARYDPTFLVSDGTETRPVPVKWDSVSATGGIGWDFPITEHWVVRPIVNFTLGHVASDLAGLKWWLERQPLGAAPRTHRLGRGLGAAGALRLRGCLHRVPRCPEGGWHRANGLCGLRVGA